MEPLLLEGQVSLVGPCPSSYAPSSPHLYCPSFTGSRSSTTGFCGGSCSGKTQAESSLVSLYKKLELHNAIELLDTTTGNVSAAPSAVSLKHDMLPAVCKHSTSLPDWFLKKLWIFPKDYLKKLPFLLISPTKGCQFLR